MSEVERTGRLRSTGKVWLVGAGPGDPGLMTVRGAECLRQADVVIYDRLAGRGLRRYAPQAEWIDVGKQPDHHPVPQSEINRILVDQALGGKQVVRLKGGDPFVFGRGGEEALALVEAGISFEIVPGVTSAVAVPAYAGIPVTQRSLVSSFLVATGHHAEASIQSGSGEDFACTQPDTRVYLMGVQNLAAIVQSLVENGSSEDTPAAVIARGTTSQQQVVTGTLKDIVIRAAGISSPAITVVGEVVRLREHIRWFDLPTVRPLLGLRVLNTRPRETGGLDELTDALDRLGAQVVELPAFRLAEPADQTRLDGAIQELDRRFRHSISAGQVEPAYHWILFTSPNAVRFFLDRLVHLRLDARILGGVRLGAVGRATAEALRAYHLYADFVPSRFSGLDWAAEVGNLESQRILLPRSEAGMAGLVPALTEKGAQVDEVTVYTLAPSDPDPEALEDLLSGKVDVAVYFSPSAVHGVRTMLDAAVGAERAHQILSGIPAACIGPTTAAAAQESGLQVAFTPAEYTLEGLVEALAQWQAKRAER